MSLRGERYLRTQESRRLVYNREKVAHALGTALETTVPASFIASLPYF